MPTFTVFFRSCATVNKKHESNRSPLAEGVRAPDRNIDTGDVVVPRLVLRLRTGWRRVWHPGSEGKRGEVTLGLRVAVRGCPRAYKPAVVWMYASPFRDGSRRSKARVVIQSPLDLNDENCWRELSGHASGVPDTSMSERRTSIGRGLSIVDM
jgi:hypothetical protein